MLKSEALQGLQIRGDLERTHPDVLTPEALSAITALAPLNEIRRHLMRDRIERRAGRARDRRRADSNARRRASLRPVDHARRSI